jgi:hypothetical protein
MILQNKRLKIMSGTVVFLLLIPAVAMQFTNEVKWSISDFIIAGLLLFGTVLVLEFILRKVTKKENRLLFVILILALLVLTWLELAVGIFSTPIAGS